MTKLDTLERNSRVDLKIKYDDYVSAPVIDSNAFELYHGKGPIPKNYKISCLNDDMFQVLFNSTEYKEFTSYLISLELGIDYKYVYEHIKFLNDQFNRDTYLDEGLKGDLLINLDNHLISFEVNNTDKSNRNITYLDKAEDDLNQRGTKMEYYKSATQISYNNYEKKNFGYIEEFMLKNKEGKLLTNRKQYRQVHIAFLNRNCYNIEEMSELDKFRLVMATTDVLLAKKLAKGNEIMEKLIKVSKEVENSNKLLFKSYNHVEAEKELSREKGLEQGLEQGREQGREEERLNVAKNLIKLKLSIETIKKATNLSEKTIKTLM